VIKPIDLGVCQGYEYEGDPDRTAVALPGSMLAGMPALWWVFEPLLAESWRIVLVWDQFLDRTKDPTEWSRARAEAAAEYAGDVSLVVAKSLTTRAAGLAADRGWKGIWLTPLLDDDESVAGLRRRTAPALLVGGTADPTWNGALARELSDDVLEIEGADHGLARIDQAPQIADAVRAFA
jgi:pimeloyl-ACP methyl ester carboxylesterase